MAEGDRRCGAANLLPRTERMISWFCATARKTLDDPRPKESTPTTCSIWVHRGFLKPPALASSSRAGESSGSTSARKGCRLPVPAPRRSAGARVGRESRIYAAGELAVGIGRPGHLVHMDRVALFHQPAEVAVGESQFLQPRDFHGKLPRIAIRVAGIVVGLDQSAMAVPAPREWRCGFNAPIGRVYLTIRESPVSNRLCLDMRSDELVTRR